MLSQTPTLSSWHTQASAPADYITAMKKNTMQASANAVLCEFG